MISEEIIINGESNEEEVNDTLSRRFRALAKEYLRLDVTKEIDFVSLIKQNSRFFSFVLPPTIGEMFLRYELAPAFWLYRSPLIIYIEDFFKISLAQSNGQNIHNSIKDFYAKWVITSSGNEKKYFAASTINFIEKKASKSNFFYLILESIIFSYDKQFFNPQKSLELLDEARELIEQNKVNDVMREELHYLINLYSGFLFLNQKDNFSASNKFSDALTIKPYGITAKFYKALSDVKNNDEVLSPDVLNELFDFDLKRINHAIELNNVSLLDYFLDNSVVSNFFYYSEFISSVEMFSNFFRDIKNTRNFDLNAVKVNLVSFKELKISEYYTPQIIQNIAFLESVLQKYSVNDSILFLGVSEHLQRKFHQSIELVVNEIRNKYFIEIQEKIKKFEVELQDKLSELEIMKKNFENIKIKLKDKLTKSLQEIEKRSAENIALLEERISNLHLIQSLNPKTAFKNAMTYNLILSFTVSLMGGCAGYSNNFTSDGLKINNIFSIVITTGLKWGAVAFVIGFFIALVAAGLALLESSNQKQRLLQTINAVKTEKEQHIAYFKAEAETKEKELEEKFARDSEQIKNYIDKLKVEKEEQEKIYQEEAEQKIAEEAKNVLALL
jgi:hypothetical protein